MVEQSKVIFKYLDEGGEVIPEVAKSTGEYSHLNGKQTLKQ